MTAINPTTLSIQIKSLMIYEFLKDYNRLEKVIRKIFEDSLSSLPDKIIYQLHFYNGSRLGACIDFQNDAAKLNIVKFDENETFHELKIHQIIKLFRKNSCLNAFELTVPSVQRTATEYSFYDCVLRLLHMRNILAHEMVDLTFTNADLIELLSIEQIESQNFEILKNYDIHRMDNMTQYIASNLVYMRKLIDMLESSQH